MVAVLLRVCSLSTCRHVAGTTTICNAISFNQIFRATETHTPKQNLFEGEIRIVLVNRSDLLCDGTAHAETDYVRRGDEDTLLLLEDYDRINKHIGTIPLLGTVIVFVS